MNWFDWSLIIIISLNIISVIAVIGKDRKPVSPTIAIINTIIGGLLIAGVVYF